MFSKCRNNHLKSIKIWKYNSTLQSAKSFMRRRAKYLSKNMNTFDTVIVPCLITGHFCFLVELSRLTIATFFDDEKCL